MINPSIPANFDPVTLNHWLWFKYQCHECSPTEFQSLFEKIIKRTDPKFMQIRPYGNIGDRKCDGLFFDEGESTVFQVYSPDELKLADVIKKVREDLNGAVENWGPQLKKWIFVYNARRGLGPDIPKILDEKRTEYPQLIIDHLSSDALWEKARDLTLQQRSEILGAPNGYEHLFFSSTIDAEEIKERLGTDSFVLIQDLMSPISLHEVSEALAPARPFGLPYLVRPTFDILPWDNAALEQKAIIGEIIAKSREIVPRFSVFSLSQIPFAIHLGFLLSDRIDVRCFQFDRDNKTWRWNDADALDMDYEIKSFGLPDDTIEDKIEVSIAISISASVLDTDVTEAAPNSKITVKIFVDRPDVMWLKVPEQLLKLAKTFRKVLASIREKVPRCSKIHLFYAGPTGGAISIGQQINPRMNPPVVLYQYSRQSNPRNTYALTLTEKIS